MTEISLKNRFAMAAVGAVIAAGAILPTQVQARVSQTVQIAAGVTTRTPAITAAMPLALEASHAWAPGAVIQVGHPSRKLSDDVQPVFPGVIPALLLTGKPVAGPVPTPPPSVSSPVVGTTLVYVWNLQATDATGPRFAYTNGTWPGGTGTFPTQPSSVYLAGLRDVGNNPCVYFDNSGNIIIWCAADTTLVIQKFDFDGAPPIRTFGDRLNITFSDCYFGPTTSVEAQKDVNSNTVWDKTVTLTITYCDFNVAAILLSGTNTFEQHHCKMRNQAQVLWTVGNDMSAFPGAVIRMNVHHNYLTGGGVNAPGSHIEMVQFSPDGTAAAGQELTFDSNMVWLKDGQANINNGSWTGYFAVGNIIVQISNSIWKGIPEINAVTQKPEAPDGIFGSILNYGTPMVSVSPASVVFNCVWDAGSQGFCHSSSTHMSVSTGNRTLAGNVQITTGASF